ncbi:hypothetical protein PM025_15915 [Halorubrum ezzemoulense]|uniref:DUF7342 family protein n=1 Tax=Halorubrum ezzemoulense TaxID=337243 RepID=UPI00232B7292|nr:hypothetical protein [Halorubrum ezzemoulense]MDB2265593.1 hypothetical protein [Halorubrum ezzemoulense]
MAEDESKAGSSPRDTETAEQQWRENRTTFQRVYDVISGVTKYERVDTVAERAACSVDGARNALTQLTEMGIVTRRGNRPVEFRRNDSYFRWKRIETLAGDHSRSELRERLNELIDEDAKFQDQFAVPDPNAVPSTRLADNDHTAVHESLESLSRWRTVRYDIELLQDAITRVERHQHGDDQAGVSA